MKQIEMMVCIPAGRAVRLSHSSRRSSLRFFNSPNPSDSERFRIGVTVGPRFNGGLNGSCVVSDEVD